MRLLKYISQDHLELTQDLTDNIPPYAILSHTWGRAGDEVTFADLQSGAGQKKPGYAKIEFCGRQAKKDNIDHFWIDTCCMDKTNHVELSEAIVSMYRWYRDAEKCYVYLSDVSSDDTPDAGAVDTKLGVDRKLSAGQPSSFSRSRWFTRGWTLQELLAPQNVEFFSQQGTLIGTKVSLLQSIHEITGIPQAVMQGAPLSHYSVGERMQWASRRQTKKPEDKAYCLFGIFDVYLPLIYGEGERAFVRLREAIDQQFGTPLNSIHTHWCVTRSANSLFTGRTDILEDLESFIREHVAKPPGNEQCRIVISGIGGQGKSEICLQLARRLRILWIDVSTEANAERSFLDISQKLSMHADSWHDARHNISNLKHPWLMILDNADDLSIDYSVYFSDGNPGAVILTSRNDECQHYASTATASIVLERLETYDAQDLLLKAARISPNQYCAQKTEAEVVASLLQSHALALVQAGAYISNGHCTLSEYPHMYERRRKRLLEFRPRQARSRYGDVYATFEVSAETLKNSTDEAAGDALILLPLLAMCAPSRFPLGLFKETRTIARRINLEADDAENDDAFGVISAWHVNRLPAFLNIKQSEWDPFRLNEAIRVLRTLSLVAVDVENGSSFVSMHALVHAWARDRQDQDETQQSWLQMGCIMAIALSDGSLSQRLRRHILAHCEAITDLDLEKVYVGQPSALVTRIISHLMWNLDYHQANAQHSRLTLWLLSHLNLSLSEVDPKYLSVYLIIARDRERSGKFTESIELFEMLAQYCDNSMPETDFSRLVVQRLLAQACLDDRQIERATSLLEHVVNVESKVLPEEDTSRLSSQHALALVYEENGQRQKAIDLFEHVIDVESRVLAEDDPGRLMSIYSLCVSRWENGDREEAYSKMTHVVKMQERVLDSNNIHRKGARSWLDYMMSQLDITKENA